MICKLQGRLEVFQRREGEKMSLEAIQKVTEIERQMQERKLAADAEARQMVAEAEKIGILHLQKVRDEAAEQGTALLKEAEKRAEEKAAEIQKQVTQESEALRQLAEMHLEEAAEFIVGRVVNQ